MESINDSFTTWIIQLALYEPASKNITYMHVDICKESLLSRLCFSPSPSTTRPIIYSPISMKTMAATTKGTLYFHQ